MHLDRLDADRENFCDLSVRTPFGDELDHGLLSSRQRSLARFLEQEALEQRLGYLASEEGLVISQRLNRGDQEAAGVGLEEKSTCTSLEHVPDEGIRIVHREDQDLDSRKLGADLRRVASTPLSVGRPKSRTATSGRVATASSTASLPSDASATTSPTRLRLQNRAQPGAHHVVVVCDQDPRHQVPRARAGCPRELRHP